MWTYVHSHFCSIYHFMPINKFILRTPAQISRYLSVCGRNREKNERNNESILRKFLKDQMFVVTYPSHQRQVYLPHDVTKLHAQWDLPWLQAYKAIPCLWVITPKWKWYLSISVFIYKEIVELNWEVNVI